MTRLAMGDRCKNGHAITPENAYYRMVGGTRCVRCRTCQLAGAKKYYRAGGAVQQRVRARRQWFNDVEASRATARVKKREEYAQRRAVILARCKAWLKANRDKRAAYMSRPQMRLHGNVSRAIRSAIRLNKAGRGWESLVGYTRADLVAHLEQRFLAGMTWENYGEWEIDHIRPRVSFAFVAAEDQQFKECWALNNLQPLWMPENRRKHARWNGVAA